MNDRSRQSPFARATKGHISRQDFVQWIETARFSPLGLSEALSRDIAEAERELRSGEAASLLRVLRDLVPFPSPIIHGTTVSFPIVGANCRDQEYLNVGYAIGLGLQPILHVLPSLGTRTLPPFSLPEEGDAAVTQQSPGYYVHRHDSLIGAFLGAVRLSGTQSVPWNALEILSAALSPASSHCLCVDIKAGTTPPFLPYKVAFDLGLRIVKIAYLAEIKCRVLVTDGAGTSSLALGMNARRLELLRNALGVQQSPYARVATRMLMSVWDLVQENSKEVVENRRVDAALGQGLAWEGLSTWWHPSEDDMERAIRPENTATTVPVLAMQSGYLQGINLPLLETRLRVLARANREQFASSEDPGLICLRSIGDHINVGDQLAAVVGYRQNESITLNFNELDRGFVIGAERPMVPSPVRVDISLDSILVRSWIIVVIPALINNGGFSLVFTSEEGSLNGIPFLAKAIGPRLSRTHAVKEAAKMAAGVDSDLAPTRLVELGDVTDEHPIYQAEEDKLIAQHYLVYVAYFDTETEMTVEGATNGGAWIQASNFLPSRYSEGLGVRASVLRDIWELAAGELLGRNKGAATG